jgi:hypothetical protein
VSGAATGGFAPSLGVLVPCRNEARVIERKLANLARCLWPSGRHRIVVVDDASDDGTAQAAQCAAARLFGGREDVAVLVEASLASPGKAGAIGHGVARLAGADLVVLTDADVVLAADALLRLAAAFADRRVGMACGSQTFVRSLAPDGTAPGSDGTALLLAGEPYDRVTAVVRALESRSGRLFSVHGQLLAWRASLALRPAPGVAADDLDLMLAVRERGRSDGRVVRVADARFFEVKTRAGAGADAQALRRARAYVQVVSRPGAALGESRIDRAQWACYRWVPLAAPELLFALLASVVATACVFAAPLGVVLLAGIALAGLSRTGRGVLRLARIIRLARRLERREPVSDRWEMERS